MMNCDDLDRLLADYLAGRLDDPTAIALEEHAGGCAGCAERLEASTRLPLALPRDVAPPAAVRQAVLDRITASRSPARQRRWWVPAAIAATLVIGFAVTRPASKSAMIPRSANPAAIAASRADGEFTRLDAARREIEAALRASPGDADLEAALARLDAQRRQLANIVMEFES